LDARRYRLPDVGGPGNPNIDEDAFDNSLLKFE
jgi:hypothetical protein